MSEDISFIKIELNLKPVEIMRVKNIIRGRAEELEITHLSFSDEIPGAKRLPCSGYEQMQISVIIKHDDKKEAINELVDWLRKKWK